MKNLSEAGLVLETLTLSDIGTLISKINHNFSMILKLPAFKGMQGNTGTDGVGISGVRGSVWTVIDSTLTTSLLAAYGLTSASQITLAFINTQVSTNLPDFLTNFGFTELVGGDVLVLPDLSVIIYDEGTAQFEDTGISFANGVSLTTQQVQDIVTTMLSGITSDDSIDAIYLAVAKLFSDTGGGINTTYNNDSVLDIPVVGAGAGVQLPAYKIIAPKEAKLAVTDNPVFVRGVAQDYHALIQATLDVDTHDYGVGVDNTPIMVLLQNDYESGIFMGHRAETSMRLFSKIYKTGSNSLRLTGRNELIDTDMTYLDLSATIASLYGKEEVIIGTENSLGTMTINVESVIQKYLNLGVDVAGAYSCAIGNITDIDRLFLLTKETAIISDLGANVKFLGLSNYVLADSGYSVATSYTQNSASALVTSDLTTAMNNALLGSINTTNTNLANFIAQIAGENHFIQRGNCPQDLNNATDIGIYQISPNPSPSYSNYPNISGGNLGDINNSGSSTAYSDGGTLIVFRYDHTKTVSTSAYDMVMQVLAISVPDVVTGFPTQERGQWYLTRTGSNSSGVFNFSAWQVLIHSGMYDLSGTGLGTVLNTANNKFTLNLDSGISSHTTLSTGVDYPAVGMLYPYVSNIAVDTHGRTHGATMVDLNETMKHYVPEGTVIMWSGDYTANESNLTSKGWILCNGVNAVAYLATKPFIPNLENKFVVGLGNETRFNAIHKTTDNGGQPSDTKAIITGLGRYATLTRANLPNERIEIYGLPETSSTYQNNMYGAPFNSGLASVTTAATDIDAFELNLTQQFKLYTDVLGSSTPIEIIPRYYTLAFLCKIYV